MDVTVIAGVIVSQLVIGVLAAIINGKILGIHFDYLKERVTKVEVKQAHHGERLTQLEKSH